MSLEEQKTTETEKLTMNTIKTQIPMNTKKYAKAIITNDFQLTNKNISSIPYQIININQHQYKVSISKSEKGNSTYLYINNYIPLFFGNILVDKIEKDQFDRSYYELPNVFAYPLVKPIIDTIKRTYPDYKVYSEIKKIYTQKPGMKEYIRISAYMNDAKKTINVSLAAM